MRGWPEDPTGVIWFMAKKQRIPDGMRPILIPDQS